MRKTIKRKKKEKKEKNPSTVKFSVHGAMGWSRYGPSGRLVVLYYIVLMFIPSPSHQSKPTILCRIMATSKDILCTVYSNNFDHQRF